MRACQTKPQGVALAAMRANNEADEAGLRMEPRRLTRYPDVVGRCDGPRMDLTDLLVKAGAGTAAQAVLGILLLEGTDCTPKLPGVGRHEPPRRRSLMR